MEKDTKTVLIYCLIDYLRFCSTVRLGGESPLPIQCSSSL